MIPLYIKIGAVFSVVCLIGVALRALVDDEDPELSVVVACAIMVVLWPYAILWILFKPLRRIGKNGDDGDKKRGIHRR